MVRSAVVGAVASFALMFASMMLRAESWHAIAPAALPKSPFRRRDATSA